MQRFKNIAVASAFIALFSAPAIAAEQDHAPRLLELARLIDQVPTADQLRAAGAGEAGAALVAIARDASLDRYTRVRATSFAVHFPGSEQALASIAEDTEFDDIEVRITAVASLSHLERARGLPRLERLLGDKEVQIRAAATRAVARIPGSESQRLLRRRLDAEDGESVVWVRELIARKLVRPSAP